MKHKNLFKNIFIFSLLLLFSIRVAIPVGIFADDSATDSATINITPTPTPSVTITNNADIENTVNGLSNSGNNTIQGGDSTPSASLQATDSAELEATPSATPTTEATNTITTGNAINTTTAENDINTTSVNSQIIYQTINIFLDENGNLDLTKPISIAEHIASISADPTTDVVMKDANNYATVDNAIVSSADTGDNTASGNGSVIINTGNAYSIVSLINKVNLTLVDSTIHVITINIYGNLNGNIILPDLNNPSACTSCSIAMTVNNQANVTNNINNIANTGDNTIASSSGSITTGNATNMVNITNILNTVLYEALFGHIYVNAFGTWNGSFLGWEDNPSQNGGTSLDISTLSPTGTDTSGCTQCSVFLQSTNSADITNNISNSANTGNNTTYGNNGSVVTGNAYAFTNLINLINSTFIHTTGLLGFINIFGTLNGDIGSAKYFPTPTPPVEQNTQQNITSDSTIHKEDGGALSVTTSNNVGAYVLPGDTVTFFANVQNTGTGKVYDAALHLSLIQNNQEVGGADFALGDINAGHGAKLSTGLVLSNTIQPGTYTARVTVTGTTGDNNTNVSASADSTFLVSGIGYPSTTKDTTQLNTPHQQDILGTTTQNPPKESNTLLFVLFGIVAAYIAIRILRAKKHLAELFAPGENFKQRLNTLRLFLL